MLNNKGSIMDRNNENYSILIVEDEQLQMERMVFVLKSVGYKTITAQNGAEALNQLENNKVDLILMDITMPIMDGLEACKIINSNDQYKDIPIIFISALDDEDLVILGLELGARDYVTKPFRNQILLARIASHIKLSKASEIIKQKNQELENLLVELSKHK